MENLNPELVNSLVAVREFLGWCLLVNMGLLIISTISLVVAREWVSKIHGRLFGLGEPDLSRSYFDFLAHFKILVIVLNFTPWVVLHIVV